uniref:Orcokinin n=1 Tax=Anopheles farauti TaxID=69004 RepID=A0A182QQJ0_9DIPT
MFARSVSAASAIASVSMVKLHLVCGVLLFAFLGWAHGLPVKEQELEEVLTKLQELKRLNDEYLFYNRVVLNSAGMYDGTFPAAPRNGVGSPFGRSSRSLDSIGGGNLLKRASLDSIGGGNLLKKSSPLPACFSDSVPVFRIVSLRQLKQVNEEKLQLSITPSQQRSGSGSSGAAPGATTAGYKTKRSLNNSDRRTLLYNYYSRGLAPMYDKRNFDEIDRFARFNGKRNLDYEPSYAGTVDHGYNGRFSKRNFDEIDRFNAAGFNYRLNGDDMASIGKRNFDEIDRFGRFAFNKRYFPEVNELSSGNNLKHDLSEDMAVINEYSQ